MRYSEGDLGHQHFEGKSELLLLLSRLAVQVLLA